VFLHFENEYFLQFSIAIDQPLRKAEFGSACFEEFKKLAYHFDMIGLCKCFDCLAFTSYLEAMKMCGRSRLTFRFV